MDKDRLQHLFTIVQKVLSLEPHERERYIQEECGNDTALKTEVYEMLKTIDDSESFWEEWHRWNERQAEHILSNTGTENRDSIGEMIGPWRLLKQLGEGGMGIVYLAERADGNYRQRVALKLLRQVYQLKEFQSRSVLRFQQERQILAQLDHPNIARLYDGGYTGDGLPWLAMEYVDGIPVTEWCRIRNSSVKERLQLFVKICEAIRYAHRNLIVHRDLKPENILVTHDGRIKILDFGIAKLLDDDISISQRALTQTGLRALSLTHAAPEQIAGESITTATDVYALGLLLYELITGVYPFKLDGLNVRQIERIMREEEPDKPGTVRNIEVTIPDAHEIRGDLDAITMKALRKEPEQRYENAGTMLDDIIRHQRNLPIEARHDTITYRFGKFIRRHSKPLAATFLFFVGVVALTVYYTWQLSNERDIAQREAVRAEQVSTFLTDLFKASHPAEARGENLTALDLMERGTQRIEELADQPEVQANMMHIIGHVYRNLGDLEQALPMLQQALELKESIYDPSNPEIAESHFQLGILLHDMGDFRGATPHFEKAVEIYRMNPDHLSPEYAASLENMSGVYDARGNYQYAEELHRESLRIRLSLFGPDNAQIARNHFGIGFLRYRQGDLDGAINEFRKALAIIRSHEMEDTPFGGQVLRELGNRLIDVGAFGEADDLLNEVLQIDLRIHGMNHMDTGLTLRALAALNYNRGDYPAADSLYDEAIDILQKAIGYQNPLVGIVMQDQGDLYIQTGDYIKAEKVLRESLTIFENAARVSPLRIITARQKLGATLVKLQQFEEAEELLLESLATASEMAAGNEDNEQLVVRSLEELVVLYIEWGRLEQSEQYRAQLAGILGE